MLISGSYCLVSEKRGRFMSHMPLMSGTVFIHNIQIHLFSMGVEIQMSHLVSTLIYLISVGNDRTGFEGQNLGISNLLVLRLIGHSIS